MPRNKESIIPKVNVNRTRDIPGSYDSAEWMEGAPCRETPSIFFAPARDTAAQQAAKDICAQCPAIEICSRYTLAIDSKFKRADIRGVSGGMTTEERRKAWDEAHNSKK